MGGAGAVAGTLAGEALLSLLRIVSIGCARSADVDSGENGASCQIMQTLFSFGERRHQEADAKDHSGHPFCEVASYRPAK